MDESNGREDLLRIFVRNTPAAVAMLDRDLRYLAHSDRWCTDYQLPERDLTGLRHYDVFPEIPRRWKDIHRRVLGGRVERAEEDRFERADGSVDWVTWECRPWRDEKGRVGGLVMFTEVVTDRVREREERAQLEERMRDAQRLESLGVLAGGVAHDFNNLLVGILGNASFALDVLPEGSRAADAIRAVERAAQRAAEMTHQLLAFAGRGGLTRKPLDLNHLVEETLRLVGDTFPPRIAVRLRLDPELPWVQGDRALLGQVVMNLLTNAAEALAGGGELRVETRTAARPPEDLPWVRRIEARSEGPYAVLEVRDDGCGMEPDTARRIFEPFYTTKFTGRGLGLAATLGTVSAHRGGIQLATEPGAGTVVRVVLPGTAAAALADADADEQRAPAPVDVTVLVIDDDSMVRDLVRRVLSAAGFAVHEAERGEQAVKGLREGSFAPDVVLLDLTMPGLSGDEVLRELRLLRPGLPVLIMSGYAATDAAETLRGQSVEGFLHKPFRPQDLVSAIHRAVERA